MNRRRRGDTTTAVRRSTHIDLSVGMAAPIHIPGVFQRGVTLTPPRLVYGGIDALFKRMKSTREVERPLKSLIHVQQHQ